MATAEKNDGRFELDRRDLLKLLSLLLGAAATGTLTSCSRCGGDHGRLPFSVWREIRDALRTSPDHLVARADQLVAEPDPARLFKFVRDAIATYPTGPYSIDGMRATRWGSRGTLRGGAGTPREKAELLAELYRRAGWEAEVLQAVIPMPKESVQQVLLRPLERPFAPEISERQMKRWRSRLELPKEPQTTLPRIDPGGAASQRLAQMLEQNLPEERAHRFDFDWRWHGGGVPVVRVQADGQTRYANLFTPDTPFGEAGMDPERLRTAPEPTGSPAVEVTLSTALASSPTERIELVKGSWSLEELVGRQVVVQMLPGMDLRRQAVSSFRDVQTFIPALAVQGFDLDKAAMEALSVLGDPISRQGDRIEIPPEGPVAISGRPLTSPDKPTTDAVAALALEIDSAHYPSIRLRAKATDARGASVDGLVASDFRIEENERSAGFLLSANRAAPRIMFLSDASGSMPPEYRGKGMDQLVADFTRRIRSEHPHADVRVKATTSELWKWLAWAAATDANLIIYATDGHLAGELTDEIRAALAEVPPLVILNVYGYEEDNFWYRRTFAPMAEITNGTIVSVTEPAEAEAAILAYLRELAPELPAYHFTYGAPSDDPGERKVVLGTGDGRVTATGTYIAPEKAPPQTQLCGLYLTVKVDRQSFERTLAGHDPVRHERMPVTDAMLNETLGACFGSHYLSFEAAAPSFSVWLDDFLSAKLSIESLDQTLQKNRNFDALEERVKEGFVTLPPELFLQALPLHERATARSLTYENGPRVMLYQAHPVFGESHLVRRIDILPFTTFATAVEGSEDAFRLTMEKTARFAVAEASLFPVSTRSVLDGEQLVEYRTLQRNRDLPPEERNLWSRRIRSLGGRDYHLVPADGNPLALWKIDPQTGSLLGILTDGSGGGSAEERIKKQLEEIDEVMGLYNTLLGQMGSMAGVPSIGGAALGVVAAYGQLLTRLYAAASLAIAVMDASGIEETVARALQEFACNVKKSIFTAAFGGWGDAFSGLDYLISAIGGDENNPFSCS